MMGIVSLVKCYHASTRTQSNPQGIVTCKPGSGETEAGRSLGLASQFSLIGSGQTGILSQSPRWISSKGCHLRLPANLRVRSCKQTPPHQNKSNKRKGFKHTTLHVIYILQLSDGVAAHSVKGLLSMHSAVHVCLWKV